MITTEDTTPLAVRAQARRARATSAAAHVDLGHDAPADPRTILGLLDAADHLVAEHAREARVAAHDREIRRAHARQRHPYEHFVGAGLGLRSFGERDGLAVEDQRAELARAAAGGAP